MNLSFLGVVKYYTGWVGPKDLTLEREREAKQEPNMWLCLGLGSC